MSLDPIITIRQLEKQYKDFLNAQFSFRNPELNAAAMDAISHEAELFNGPYIEASMPYSSSNTLEDLVKAGKLNKNINKAFTDDEYRKYKRYIHQEKAFNLIEKGHNIVVSSGTGSGKTECFLVPIINELLNEYDNKTLCDGVRAILVYPMNALANDQMDRFRIALKDLPQITFGRYIGDTPSKLSRQDASIDYRKTHNGEDPLQNELLTREEMHNNPPHILVTNYAMLEYMLLRPETNTIFQGPKATHFKFLVLDEAHTYHGAHGTEVSMLIRRLKERIFGKSDNCLQCIATSATLGGGKDDIDNVINFANQLFSETFTPEDIILSERDTLSLGANNSYPYDIYSKILSCYRNNDLITLKNLTNSNSNSIDEIIYNFIINDQFCYNLRKIITTEVLTIDNIAKNFPDDDLTLVKNAIICVVELGSKIIDKQTGLPLINAKYHIFARSLEGGFVCFYPKIKVFTERHKEYNGSPVYELMNCIHCGQEYIIGNIEQDDEGNDFLNPNSTSSNRNSIFMVCNKDDFHIEEDEDEWETEIDLNNKALKHFYLCPKCGKIYPFNEIDCCDIEKIHLIKMPDQKAKNLCLQCGRNRAGTLKKMITGEDSSTEILTRTLYQLLPAENNTINNKPKSINNNSIYSNLIETDTTVTDTYGNGRKLLLFSDSRQEAAKFSMFLQTRYNDWIWKNLIWSAINELNDYEELSFDGLVLSVQKKADKYNLFSITNSDDDEKAIVSTQIMKEFIEYDPKISLVGLGLINVSFNIDIIDDPIFNNFTKYGFTLQEVKKLFFNLFDSLRKQGAVQFPDNVDPANEVFAPRNRIFSFKRQGGETSSKEQCFGWLPSKGKSNRRLDYVKKLLIKKGYNETDANETAIKILSEIYDEKGFVGYFSNKQIIVVNQQNNHLSLNYRCWRFSKVTTPLYKCNKCGSICNVNIDNVCTQIKCDGKLLPIDESNKKDYFYRNTYKNMKPIPMSVAEHTAQLTSDYATSIQNKFKENKINVLSCSTTFEMGVDIGSLEAVVLRNVPPETSNYVQRAGRAGRRNSSAALILTFARRRSHDLTFFNEPQKMIKGIIKAPYLTLDNDYLIQRHLQSVVMAYFFRNYSSYYGHTAKCLIKDNGVDADLALFEMLQKHPEDLLISMETIIPTEAKNLFNLNNWEWITNLVNNRKSDNAIFDSAIYAYKQELNELVSLQNTYVGQKKYRAAMYAQDLIKTHESQDMIGFLSTYGIIPRYGFPVDVVPLKIMDHSEEAKNIELTRDLRMAITEYGPNTEVVAGNKIWKPYALRTQGNKKWPTADVAICPICGKIYSYNTVLGEEAPNKVISCCNYKLQYNQIVKPIFGFTTKNINKTIKRSSSEAVHYSSTSYFEGFLDKNLIIENECQFGNRIVKTRCASQGKMIIINNGAYSSSTKMGQKFKICPSCGYMTIGDFPKSHQRADGTECSCKLELAYLGHDFHTDVLEISLPLIKNFTINNPSLLYAIIEGSSSCLDIDRRELGGSILGNEDNCLVLVIYDTVPGGAGHVKRIQQNIKPVLQAALDKVSGKCGCGKETSCYGCLRNYDNQRYHEVMSRGNALEYLQLLLNSKNKL